MAQPPASGVLVVTVIDGARPLRLPGWVLVEVDGVWLITEQAPLATEKVGMPAAPASADPNGAPVPPADGQPPER